MNIKADRLGAFFARYREVENVLSTISKAEIDTGDFVLQVILMFKSIGGDPQRVDVPG